VLSHLILIEPGPDIPEGPLLREVADEINRTTAKGKADSGMIPNLQRTLHAILGEDGLESVRNLLLAFLIHVSHCVVLL